MSPAFSLIFTAHLWCFPSSWESSNSNWEIQKFGNLRGYAGSILADMLSGPFVDPELYPDLYADCRKRSSKGQLLGSNHSEPVLWVMGDTHNCVETTWEVVWHFVLFTGRVGSLVNDWLYSIEHWLPLRYYNSFPEFLATNWLAWGFQTMSFASLGYTNNVICVSFDWRHVCKSTWIQPHLPHYYLLLRKVHPQLLQVLNPRWQRGDSYCCLWW